MRLTTVIRVLLCGMSCAFAKPLAIAISRTITDIKEHWGQLAVQNIKDYAEYHGYHLHLSGHIDKTRHPAWSKVKAWQYLLQHYDWVWQTDADMAVMDMHRRLETFIDSEYDIIIGRDCNVFHLLLDRGYSPSIAMRASLNTGSFFLKSSPWTFSLLDNLYKTNGSHISDINDWWENAAMIYLTGMDSSLYSHIKYVPGRLFNAWPPILSIVLEGRKVSKFCNHTEATFYQIGDFAIHFVGKNKEGLSTYLEQRA